MGVRYRFVPFSYDSDNRLPVRAGSRQKNNQTAAIHEKNDSGTGSS